MECTDIESMLADALGGELSPADQPAFEAHLAECDTCRLEYESSRAAAELVRSLPMAPRVSVRRDGPRLVIGPASSAAIRLNWFNPSLLRYAAAIVLAFAVGYAFRASSRPTPDTPPVARNANQPSNPAQPSGTTLRTALAAAHASSPNRSDLAKCLSGLLASNGR